MNTKQKLGVSVILSALLFTQGNAAVIGTTLVVDNGISITDNTVSNTISSDGQDENILGISHHCVSDPCSNSATITASTTGVSSEANGIQSWNDNNQLFTNTGTVSVSTTGIGSEAYGIRSYYMGGNFANSGIVNVNISDSDSKAYGMFLITDGTNTFNNSGTVSAKIGGELSANAYSISTFDDGGTLNITNTSTGKLYGNISIGEDSAATLVLTNNGLVSLPHDAYLGNAARVETFTQGATGTLQIGLMSDDDGEPDGDGNPRYGNLSYSQLIVAGTATIDAASKIDVDVKTISGHQSLLLNKTLEGVIQAETLVAPDTLKVTDNSQLLDFKYVKNDNNVDLLIVQGTNSNGDAVTIKSSTIEGGGNSNASAAAGALQSIQDGGVPAGMTSYFSALNGLSTASQVSEAVASTTPQATAATATVSTQIINDIQGIVEMRQNSVVGNSGLNSGDIAFRDQNLWLKPFGSKGTQDNKDGINGFDVKAYGFGMGYDTEVSPKQRVGAAFFYTDAKADVNGMPQTSDMNAYTALIYGNVPLTDNTDFLYQTGYSWQKIQTDRTVIPTYDHATADYTSNMAFLDLKLMQDYKINNTISIRPLVETTYRHYTTPSYSESGSGASLSVDKFTSTQFILGGGAIVDYKLGSESKLVSEFHLGYDFHHDANSVTASFAEAPSIKFDTVGIDNGGWQYNVGLGYEMINILGGEINFMYNYQAQGVSFDNHTLSAKYVFKF